VTRRQLECVVAAWQSRLKLESWRLRVVWDEPCSPDADATMWRSNQYERAELRFTPGWPKWDREFANLIVAHEMCHLLTRDVEESMKISRDGLGEFVQDREIEGLVDRLAHRFVELGGLA
jgi:hypothetical protein